MPRIIQLWTARAFAHSSTQSIPATHKQILWNSACNLSILISANSQDCSFSVHWNQSKKRVIHILFDVVYYFIYHFNIRSCIQFIPKGKYLENPLSEKLVKVICFARLLVTDISTTWAVVMFRVEGRVIIKWWYLCPWVQTIYQTSESKVGFQLLYVFTDKLLVDLTVSNLPPGACACPRVTQFGFRCYKAPLCHITK